MLTLHHAIPHISYRHEACDNRILSELNPIHLIPPLDSICQQELTQQSPSCSESCQVLFQQITISLLTSLQPQGIIIITLQIPHLQPPNLFRIIHHSQVCRPTTLHHILIRHPVFACPQTPQSFLSLPVKHC